MILYGASKLLNLYNLELKYNSHITSELLGITNKLTISLPLIHFNIFLFRHSHLIMVKKPDSKSNYVLCET